MTLKDWTKVKNFGGLLFYHKKRPEVLMISSNNFVEVEGHTKENIGSMTIMYPKKFKNRTAALKFAKSYMRKH